MEEVTKILNEILRELKGINESLNIICGNKKCGLGDLEKLLSMIETNTDIIAGH